jgi:hypothetical protein
MLWFVSTLAVVLQTMQVHTNDSINPGMNANVLLQYLTISPGCSCITYGMDDGFGLVSNGTFTSPNFPQPYERDIQCLLYQFVGIPGEVIELQFFQFNMEQRQHNM